MKIQNKSIMKQKLLIVAFWIFTLLGAFALKATAQNSTHKTDTIKSYQFTTVDVLADETSITDTKTGAKIVCSNDKIHFKLYEKWQHTFKRYSWVWKKDRSGPYKEYTITVSQKDGNLIKEWAKNNL